MQPEPFTDIKPHEEAIQTELPDWLGYVTGYIKQGTDISALSYGQQYEFCKKAIYRDAQCKADARWDISERLLILIGKHETPASELQVFYDEILNGINSQLAEIEDANTDLVLFFNNLLKTLK